MVNSNKKQEYLQKWEPTFTKLGVNPDHHIKLALYAEQHSAKVLKQYKDLDPEHQNDNLSTSLTWALMVLSNLKDLNRVMITDSLEGPIGKYQQQLTVNKGTGIDKSVVQDLVNILDEQIDNGKIICVQFLFCGVQVVAEAAMAPQANCFHHYMLC